VRGRRPAKINAIGDAFGFAMSCSRPIYGVVAGSGSSASPRREELFR